MRSRLRGFPGRCELPLPTTADCRRLASMMVTGLRDGFRIADPSHLYRVWIDRPGVSALDLFALGLKREN